MILKKLNLKINTSQKFLLGVLLFYFFVFIFYPSLFFSSLKDFFSILFRIAPLLGIVFGAIFLVNLFVKQKNIQKHFGKDSGIRGWIYAIIAGILISGPPYILYPFLGELKKQGAKNSLLAVFLYNRNVKIPFFPVMVYYFGMKYTIIVSSLIVLFSILNGLLIDILLKDNFCYKKSNNSF